MTRTLLIRLLIVAAAFVAGTLLASALGAVNLGTALTFGQVAFAVALVALLLAPTGRSRD